MDAPSTPPAHLALNIDQAIEDARAALPLNRSLMRSVALASLVPFFLFFQGHYHSLTLVLVDYLFATRGTYPHVGGRFLRFTGEEEAADVFVNSVLAIAAVSLVLVCLSMVATASASSEINSGRRLTLGESFSKARGLWSEKPSVTRLYFTIIFLGYVLSVVAIVVVSLVIAGGSLRLSTWQVLLSLLALFIFLYLGILRSVDLGTFVPEESEREVEAVWSTAVALMEVRKLQGFFIFFLSLVVTHGFLLMGTRCFWRGGCYAEGFFLLPVLMNIIWMLGICGLFGYGGVLLQV